MKVLILGSSGIIGTHLRLCVPEGIEAIYHRRVADRLHIGFDLNDAHAALKAIDQIAPDVVVNLAGESRPDIVERDPEAYEWINVGWPGTLAQWCQERGARLVHISSQAACDPVNAYGRQKCEADEFLSGYDCVTVARPTFVLGIRPMPAIGRQNPMEQMLSEPRQRQVCDRWFSPSFARDVAEVLWSLVLSRPTRIVQHIGIPIMTNRYELARMANLQAEIESIAHNTLPGLAPRPQSTAYGSDALYRAGFATSMSQCRRDYESREAGGIESRAREIALFLGITERVSADRLARGFGYQHASVTADFRRQNPQDDAALLNWYRTTEEYIWELSAYHADPEFNYAGMCCGIAERLKAAGARRVLCLGDGIGDLTLSLYRAGFDAFYHDLEGSRTAEFARFRFWAHTGYEMQTACTAGWEPDFGGQYHAVVSLDFLEHVVNVPAWTEAIRQALLPGGFLCSQNAFAMGSGPNGSIPMHLACNDRYEKEWDPLLSNLGFSQESSNWYRKAVAA